MTNVETRQRKQNHAGMRIDWTTGQLLSDAPAEESVKTLGQLAGVFADAEALRAMDANTVAYRVQMWRPVAEGTEGGLFWGITTIEPGRVGLEYFMTQGHFHAKRDRCEWYVTLEGTGALILMSEDRETWMEPMSAGSAHFIPARTAHRAANTGNQPLRFMACWPSDAGHDYETIRRDGFGGRVLCVDGEPTLVESR